MKNRTLKPHPAAAAEQSDRQDTTPCRLRRVWWLGLALLLVGSVFPVQAQTTVPAPLPVASRELQLDSVQLVGATRTPVTTVYRYLGLQPGDALTQSSLIAAVDQVRQGGLFRSVSFYTTPGPERGRLVLVLEVEEHPFDFRWAAGNTDLDGWYLVPAMLAYDNPLGHGGLFDLQWRVGFRHTGLLLRYGQPRAGDGRTYWGMQLASLSTDRPYYSDGVEYRHQVFSGGLGTVLGRHFGQTRRAEVGLKLEGVEVANSAKVSLGSEDGSLEDGQEVPAEDLPLAVQNALGSDFRAVLHADWQYDTRSRTLRAGSPVRGFWGRLKGAYTLQGHRSHPGLQADLRAFQEVPGGVLAGRMRASWVGEDAAFYDRLYLGGLYSVRGFPTHSLSAAGGDTWLWSGTLEYRTRILGDHRGTRLAGIFFLDAGASGQKGEEDPYHGIALGTGYGVRWKVWWLDWIGLDVGFPLTDRPVDMNFQATASIGWSF